MLVGVKQLVIEGRQFRIIELDLAIPYEFGLI